MKRIRIGLDSDGLLTNFTKHPIRCDVFADDKLSHCIDYAIEWPGSHTILFDAHHNKQDVPPPPVRRGTWSDIIALARIRSESMR